MDKCLKDKIINLRRAGKSYKNIAALLGCSTGSVGYHCNKEGLNNIGLPCGLGNILVTEDIIEKMKKMKSVYGLKKTAELLNVSVKTVQRHTEGISIEPLFPYLDGYDRTRRRRHIQKIIGVILKGGRCQRCGYDNNWGALEFHHEDPTEKKVGISTKILSDEVLIKELSKCILVCSNCHRECHNPDKNIKEQKALFIQVAKYIKRKH